MVEATATKAEVAPSASASADAVKTGQSVDIEKQMAAYYAK